MKRLLAVAVFLLVLAAAARAQSWPDASWRRADPVSLGWSAEKLAEAERFAADLKLTAVMVVWRGSVIAAWGDVAARVSLASVRKSLLSALYGVAIAEGRIALTRTLKDLAIDDRAPALSETEKAATVRDLLMSRSGVYHAAAYEVPDMQAKRPRRGSHAPGTFWYYNNWDFNALGTIYEKATGARIFESFEHRIARPIGMEDFSANDGKYVHEPDSDHAAYVFAMSARDLARFGLLFLRGGTWNDKQIVPAAWVKESTAALTVPADFGLDYGYMWWRLSDRNALAGPMGIDTYFALGYRGQVLAVVPSRDLVIVQLIDAATRPDGVRPADTGALLRKIVAAAPRG
jgi:CubicO group peptidase (beta-lactamase class C family)